MHDQLKNYTSVSLGVLLLLLLSSTCFARNIIIIRHGEAEHNVQKVFNSTIVESVKYPLTLKGKREVLRSAQALKREYHFDDSKIERVYISPLFRTQQTAKILVEELGIGGKKRVTEKLLIETGAGRLEGKSANSFAYGKDSWDHVHAHDYGGETDQDVSERMKLFLKKLQNEKHGKDILIVTHGTPARELELLLRKDESVSRYEKAEFRIVEVD